MRTGGLLRRVCCPLLMPLRSLSAQASAGRGGAMRGAEAGKSVKVHSMAGLGLRPVDLWNCVIYLGYST